MKLCLIKARAIYESGGYGKEESRGSAVMTR